MIESLRKVGDEDSAPDLGNDAGASILLRRSLALTRLFLMFVQ